MPASLTTSPSPSPEFLALQDAVAGRFSLVRELGRGGMGIVFLARDIALDRLVAIKLLPPQVAASDDSRERFLREARTAAGLSHPNIVPIHGVESNGALTWFVMTYVEGETLGERLRRDGPLTAAESMRVVQEIAWALAHAHARGVVHRDIKPDNVLLEESTGRALVTDFGIALALGTATPAEGVLRGTPQYISPEVAQGETATAHSDLYSLGVTAWMAAAGRLPFESTSPAALLLAHVQTPAPPLAATVAGIPARFAAAIDRCLAKRPAERWESAERLVAELDAARSRTALVPAPQRSFLRDWERLGGEIATAGAAATVAASNALGLTIADLIAGSPDRHSILAWIFVLIAVLPAGLAKARMWQLLRHARALRSRGVDQRRIVAALAQETATREEERAATAQATAMNRRQERWLLAGTVVGSVASFAMALANEPAILNIFGIAGAVVLPTLAVLTGLRLIAPDGRERWWDRLLQGRLGRWMFKSRRGDRAPMEGAALEGPEPTAIALGSAARALYEALPQEAIAMLGPGVPSLIDALERKARLAAEAVERGAPADPTAVTALESLRLDLLRLSVGAIPAERLTAELERVRNVGDEIDRRLRAEGEVDALLARED
ncbi:MAG: serine/threonine protein kinase [Gemmatimonadaceae bacterium]|nr:serine/threonine protein kinase [Gemmatimonadaceae bacterium]